MEVRLKDGELLLYNDGEDELVMLVSVLEKPSELDDGRFEVEDD